MPASGGSGPRALAPIPALLDLAMASVGHLVSDHLIRRGGGLHATVDSEAPLAPIMMHTANHRAPGHGVPVHRRAPQNKPRAENASARANRGMPLFAPTAPPCTAGAAMLSRNSFKLSIMLI